MKEANTENQIFDADLGLRLPEEAFPLRIIYNDEELVVADNLRDLPDFDTYKISFNVVLRCHKGEAQLTVGNETVSLKANQTFICHSHVIVTHVMISPDFDGSVICVSDRLMKNIMQAQADIWNRVLYIRHYYILDYKKPGQPSKDMEEMIIDSFRHSKSPFKQEILVSLLRAAFLTLSEHFIDMDLGIGQPTAENMRRMDELFQRFLANINQRTMKKVSVSEYAAELCITPKYLSTICRKASGKSPIEWISEYVVADIIFYLRNTDLSAKEIAAKLGFANSSFFGKYVREHLGMTPAQYRQYSQRNL